ncbi:hypothetical protein HK405_015370, partial [Cladochytrium tenue]
MKHQPLDGNLPEDVPAFKVVASTRTCTVLYAAFGLAQLFLAVFVTAVLSSAAIFSTKTGAADGSSYTTCLLFKDHEAVGSHLAACIWPATLAAAVGCLAVAVAAYDVYSLQRLYPPRSRRIVLLQSAAAAVAAVAGIAVGTQIAVGLQATCNNFAELNWPCPTVFSLLQTDWRIVAGASAASFASALLW